MDAKEVVDEMPLLLRKRCASLLGASAAAHITYPLAHTPRMHPPTLRGALCKGGGLSAAQGLASQWAAKSQIQLAPRCRSRSPELQQPSASTEQRQASAVVRPLNAARRAFDDGACMPNDVPNRIEQAATLRAIRHTPGIRCMRLPALVR
jgi:hypothetical protein